MKKSYLLWSIVTALLLLSGCTTNRDYLKAQVRDDLVQEKWINRFAINPQSWTAKADKRFTKDYPKNFIQSEIPASAFTQVNIEGPYLVQIYGNPRNEVFLEGTEEDLRHMHVSLHDSTLYIRAPVCQACGNLRSAIIRIGMRELSALYHAGTNLVEGRNIRSHHLVIKSYNSGDILLSGNMNLSQLVQGGRGTISLLGVYSPATTIDVLGDGNVNLEGDIGVNRIIKHGKGCLTILGANTPCLTVGANNGLTIIEGNVNLRSINTEGFARVGINQVQSQNITINLQGNSRIGLAGFADDISIGANCDARFEGKCLRANTISVRTVDNAHANVSTRGRLFADAKNDSTIYFFSSPSAVSRYSKNQALIIPVFGEGCNICPAPCIHWSCHSVTPVCKKPKKKKSICPASVHSHHSKTLTATPKTVTTTTTTVTTIIPKLHPRMTYHPYKSTKSD